MEEIINYFVDRASSGFVERLNSKLKVLKLRCSSIYNLKHLFQHQCIYPDLEGSLVCLGTSKCGLITVILGEP